MNDSQDCKREEQVDLNQQEVVGTAIKDIVFSMMKETGPLVRALLLKADGSRQEIKYDSTPRNDHISKILGGSPTILGQLPGNLDGVILTKKYSPDPLVDLPNKHTVVAPYGQVLGDVFVTRLDEDIQPQHFGIQEYETYCAWRDDPEVAAAMKVEGEVDKVEEVDDEVSAEEEPDMESAIMASVVKAYMAKNGGGAPTTEQVAKILDKIGFNVVDDIPAEEDGITPEEEREYLAEAFEREHGEKPTTEQLDKLMLELPKIKAAEEAMDFPEDDEDYVPPGSDQEEINLQEVVAKVESMIMEFPEMLLPDDDIKNIQGNDGKACDKGLLAG